MASTQFKNLVKKLQNSYPTMVGDKESGTIKWARIKSPQVSYMMGGGIPTGRVIRFRGPSSAGKSAFCNYIAGNLQQECPKLYDNPNKKILIYVDFERTFETRFAETVGVLTDEDHFLHLRPRSIEELSDILMPLVETGDVAAIIFDSDASAPTKASWVDESGKATFGGQAKAISEFIRKYNIACADTGTTLLWISQERVNMKFGAHLPAVTGGEALPYYCSIICRITKSDDIKGPGDEGIIGIEMRVRNYKNKCSVPFRDAEGLKLYYKGGFDAKSEFIDFFIKFGIINQAGAYFKFELNGESYSLQGRKKLEEFLDTHPDVEKEWQERVYNSISGYCAVLDSENIAVDEDTGAALNEKDKERYNKYLEETNKKAIEYSDEKRNKLVDEAIAQAEKDEAEEEKEEK